MAKAAVQPPRFDEQFLLKGSHYDVYCFENNLPTAATTPQFNVEPKFNYQLRYQDHLYDLSQAAGFSGYFDLSRWQKNYGDGGVDVTGAPNAALVEGADAALVTLLDQRPVMLEIDVPSEGYVRFDWRKIGGSYFSLEIEAGGQRFFLEKGLNGHYISPILRAGDRLRLRLSTPQDSLTPSSIRLDNFHFYCDATQVIAREWQAVRKNDQLASFTQYISIEPLDLDKVVFPAPRHFSDAGAVYDPAALHPEITGFPYVDRDGDEQTTEDRHYLEVSNCAYGVSWEDELVLEENNWTLLRHWTISDLVSQNIAEKTQVIKLYTDVSEGHPQWQIGERSRPGIGAINPRLVIQYLDWEAPND